MNIRKTITMLIVGLAIMGLASIGMAYEGRGSDGYGSGWMRGYDYDTYEKEETTSEVPGEEEETVAEAEPEAPPMEEEEYMEEERVAPVAGEGSEEVVPDIY